MNFYPSIIIFGIQKLPIYLLGWCWKSYTWARRPLVLKKYQKLSMILCNTEVFARFATKVEGGDGGYNWVSMVRVIGPTRVHENCCIAVV